MKQSSPFCQVTTPQFTERALAASVEAAVAVTPSPPSPVYCATNGWSVTDTEAPAESPSNVFKRAMPSLAKTDLVFLGLARRGETCSSWIPRQPTSESLESPGVVASASCVGASLGELKSPVSAGGSATGASFTIGALSFGLDSWVGAGASWLGAVGVGVGTPV